MEIIIIFIADIFSYVANSTESLLKGSHEVRNSFFLFHLLQFYPFFKLLATSDITLKTHITRT